MAKVTTTRPISFDMYDLSVMVGNDVEKYTRTATLFAADYGDFQDRFTGTGFKYGKHGFPISGTVTGYQGYDEDQGVIVRITGLSISASLIADASKTTSRADDLKVFASFFKEADEINGSSYADSLNGFAGKDTITGGKGNDVLEGGTGADRFVFARGFGHDKITDFDATGSSSVHDHIDFSHDTRVDSYSDLDISASGKNVIIEVGADEIILKNVKIANIDASDFIF